MMLRWAQGYRGDGSFDIWTMAACGDRTLLPVWDVASDGVSWRKHTCWCRGSVLCTAFRLLERFEKDLKAEVLVKAGVVVGRKVLRKTKGQA